MMKRAIVILCVFWFLAGCESQPQAQMEDIQSDMTPDQVAPSPQLVLDEQQEPDVMRFLVKFYIDSINDPNCPPEVRNATLQAIESIAQSRMKRDEQFWRDELLGELMELNSELQQMNLNQRWEQFDY